MLVTVDCTVITDAKQLHRVLAATLGFPEWYGHNLDALMDCLTDLAPTALHLTGWDSLGDWKTGFAEVFTDACRENPDLTVLL